MNPQSTENQDNLIPNSVRKIFVFYICTLGKTNEQISDDILAIRKNMNSNLLGEDSVCAIIPTEGHTRLECINPVYITDKELIEKHTALLQDVYDNIKLNIEKAKNG